MRKNLIIGLLAVVSILSLTYGYIQKQRADKQEAIAAENIKIAHEQRVMAIESAKEAEMQRKIALTNLQKALEQEALLIKALEVAKRKK